MNTKTPKKKSRARRKKEEKERGRREKEYRAWLKDQKRKRGLHPAAKWKRILTKCDYWWSKANLPTDDFLKGELRQYEGWCRLSELLTFRTLQNWTDQTLMLDALTSSASKFQVEERKTSSGKLHWLVRRKNVTLAQLDEWEEEARLLEEQQDEEDVEDQDAALKEANQKNKRRRESLPKYSTGDKEILLVQKPSQLRRLCEKLAESVQDTVDLFGGRSSDNNLPHTVQVADPASALALDVEYATLEYEIQPKPAMLQLASPTVVGLIWLHRFPHFGQTILHPQVELNPEHYGQFHEEVKEPQVVTDPHFEQYEPLRQLLWDANIKKVGLGIHHDERQLLKWWGVSKEGKEFFWNGASDIFLDELYPEVGRLLLDEKIEGDDDKRSLQELCRVVLEKNLVKKKGPKSSSGGRRKVGSRWARRRTPQKKIPIHWRAKDLLPEMKMYAAQDVSCMMDIYLKLHGFMK